MASRRSAGAPGTLVSMTDDVTPAVRAPGLFASRAAERAFPSRLPAVGPLGAPVNVHTAEVSTWLAPNPGPAGVPPAVASGPGSWVGWLLRGRRGEGDGDSAA